MVLPEAIRILQSPDDRELRLAEMHLTEAVLRDAVAMGVYARRECTLFDPPTFRGMTQWARTVRSLRELLARAGWTADDGGGFSRVIRGDGRLAIAVATGDVRTGQPGFPSPATKYKRGAMTHQAIDGNKQLNLLTWPTDETFAEDVTYARVPRRETWFVLTHVRHDAVRFELSLPADISDDGRVHSWAERILFDDIELTTPMELADELPPDIDVPVERR
jgi:hypothetical protein